MKKQLLAKIKDFQNKSDKEDISINTGSINTGSINTGSINASSNDKLDEFNTGFADEFNKSLNFLSELSKQRKHKPKRNETLKKGRIERDMHIQVATELPEDMLQVKPVTFKINTTDSHVTNVATIPAQVQQTQHGQVQQTQVQQAQVQQTQVQLAQVQQAQVQQIQNTQIMSQTPSYGNLKNGSKPTYRQYHNKTQRNYGQENVIKPLIIETTPSALQVGALQVGALQVGALQVGANTANNNQRFKKRITRTLKYSLGKHKNGKVSVLIKNAKTRRKVQTEQAMLKQKTIADIKVYLRGKNLLKVGSDVPNDVLRQLYENAILAGDVTNKSKDTLIHNYFNEK
jgi:hypothetical protein